MCKMFPSSLGPVAMRWFDDLRTDSIGFFKELTRAFGYRFITCTRVPRPLDSLLSLSIGEGKTLKTYSDRYWETYNEIDGDFDDIAISTFKSGLPTEHGLRNVRESLLLACVNSWIGLTSIKGLRKISNWVKERQRLSLKRVGISGQTDSITIDLGEILLDNQGLPTPKQLIKYFENRCIMF